MARAWLSAIGIGAAAFVSASARAEAPRPHDVRLVVETSPAAAEVCPPRAELDAAIVSRLGYDPFAADGARIVLVDLGKERSRLVARVRIVGADGTSLGSREIDAAAGKCSELVGTIALTIAIAIDPLALNGPRPPEPPLTPPPPPSEETPAPEPGWVAPPREPVEIVRIGAGILGSLGSAPAPTVGFVLAGETALAEQRVHLGLEVRGDLPASADDVVGSLLVADVTGCWGRRVLGCGIVTLGVARVSSDVGRASTSYPFFAAGGVRAALDLPIGGPLVVRPYVDLEGVATRHSLRIDGESRFRFPPVMAALGALVYFSHAD